MSDSIGAIKDGFFFGLAGTSVRKDIVEKKVVDGKETNVVTEKDRIVDFTFAASGKNSKATFEVSNMEIPYPLNDESATLAASDCKVTKYRLVDGEYQAVELTGLAAAVTIALDLRRNEALRGRLREGKYIKEQELRSDAIAAYGFSLSDASKPTFNADDIRAAITAAIAAGEDVAAVVAKFGVKVA